MNDDEMNCLCALKERKKVKEAVILVVDKLKLFKKCEFFELLKFRRTQNNYPPPLKKTAF